MNGGASPLRIRPCRDEEADAWSNFIRESPQGTLFADPRFLRTLSRGYRCFWVEKGKKRVAGLYFDSDETGKAAGINELTYSGLIFAHDVSSNNVHDRHTRFKITEFVSEWLFDNFERVYLRLSPQFDDVRPFSWHNYHFAHRGQYKVDVAYTSYLTIGGLDVLAGIPKAFFARMNQLRRRNVKEGLSSGAETRIRLDAELFAESYAKMMASQARPVSDDERTVLANRIGTLTRVGAAAQFVTFDSNDVPLYTTVFGWDEKRAYYLYGAPVGDATVRYQGSLCFVQAFQWLAARGISVVDLEGVNSPRRGWFKLSFGGNLMPLYIIRRQPD